MSTLSAPSEAPCILSLKRKKAQLDLLCKEVQVLSSKYIQNPKINFIFISFPSLAFNAVVRLCIVDLIPALKRFLKSPPDEKLNLEKCKSWSKLRLHVKAYLADVIRVRNNMILIKIVVKLTGVFFLL